MGREYRIGMFLGTVFEYLAQGFVLALVRPTYTLQRLANLMTLADVEILFARQAEEGQYH